MSNLKPGKTPLFKSNELCNQFDIPNLLIKDESENPFGTWKDRRSQLIVEKAKENIIDKLCLITSGNAGFSLAKFAEGTGIQVTSIIDKNLSSSVKQLLQEVCRVVETDLSEKILKPEDVIALAREAEDEVIWEVTNDYQEAYEPLIEEIEREDPNYLICPVGSGEAFVGLYNGIEKKGLQTTLVGVAPAENPSFADKLYTLWTPYSAKVKSIIDNRHKIVELNEKEIKSAYQRVKDYINCEPSSAIIFGIFSKINLNKDDIVIAVNSGKGLN